MGNAYFELVKTQRESQKKYDYYFLAVIVTLLSLSIQSYKPSDFVNFTYIISLVWALLNRFYTSAGKRHWLDERNVDSEAAL